MRRVLVVLTVAASMCGIAQGASTAPRPSAAAQASTVSLHFDLAAQPLADALTAFHRLTGASLLYEARTASGLRANAVQGELAPAVALHRLLEGTGVVAHPTSATAFLLTREPAEPLADTGPAPRPELSNAARASTPQQDADFARYRGRLQARIVAALCAHPQTVPGSYRLALNAWIDGDGRIARVLIHPTGLASRDARIEAALAGLDLHDAVPARMAQPVSLLVLPRPPSQTGDCAPAPVAP